MSDLSANLYDLQVEILFGGAADSMRRRILAPLKQGLKTFESVMPKQMRILDVACGTGRTHYTTDDLVERLEKVGFEKVETQVHFMSKYLIAHKPG